MFAKSQKVLYTQLREVENNTLQMKILRYIKTLMLADFKDKLLLQLSEVFYVAYVAIC